MKDTIARDLLRQAYLSQAQDVPKIVANAARKNLAMQIRGGAIVPDFDPDIFAAVMHETSNRQIAVAKSLRVKQLIVLGIGIITFLIGGWHILTLFFENETVRVIPLLSFVVGIFFLKWVDSFNEPIKEEDPILLETLRNLGAFDFDTDDNSPSQAINIPDQ